MSTNVPNLDKQEDNSFDNLCAQVLDCLNTGRAIHEGNILDISIKVIMLLSSTSVNKENLPSSFLKLAKKLDDYMQFEEKTETNCNRRIMYARLFQLTHMVCLANRISERDDQIRKDALENKAYFEFLEVIHNSPGITQEKLGYRLKYSSSQVSENIQHMKKKGYLLTQRIEENVYYQLSYVGICLYNRMRENKASYKENKVSLKNLQVNISNLEHNQEKWDINTRNNVSNFYQQKIENFIDGNMLYKQLAYVSEIKDSNFGNFYDSPLYWLKKLLQDNNQQKEYKRTDFRLYQCLLFPTKKQIFKGKY